MARIPAKTRARKPAAHAPLHTPRASRQVEFFESQTSRATGDSSVRFLLSVEVAANLPKTVPQLLLDAGFDLVRTNSMQRAKAVMRAIVFDGMVLVLRDAKGAIDLAATGIELLSSRPRPPLIAIICDGEIDARVRAYISETDAKVFDFSDVRHPRRRIALTDYFRNIVNSQTVSR